jgi:hypothetical protein
MTPLKHPLKPGVELWLELERKYKAEQRIVDRILLKNLTGMLLLLVSAASVATMLALNSR